MKKILPIIFSLIFINQGFSQAELTLPNVEHIYQSTYINPAAIPDHKVSLLLPIIPSFQFGLANTGFNFKDGIQQQAGRTVFNLQQFADKLEKNNFFYFGNRIELFHLSIKARQSFIFFDVNSCIDSYIGYPGDLFQLSKGNLDANENGRTFDMSGLALNLTHYNQYAVGFSRMLKNWNFGVRLKLLQGLSNAYFNPQNFGMNVGENMYEHTFTNSATLYTSAPIDTNFNTNSVSAGDYFNFKNIGFGTDFGVTYTWRKFRFSVAANNIGMINWRNNPRSFEFSKDLKYEGLDIVPEILNGSQDLENIQIADSVAQQLKPRTKDNNQPYTTWLVPRGYFMVKYDITPKFLVSATFVAETFKGIRPGGSLAAQYKFGRILSLTASSSYLYGDIVFGGGIVLKPGPFQLFVVTDNIPFQLTRYVDAEGNTKVILPDRAKAFNIRFGMNLVFGKILPPKKQAFNY